MPRVWNRRVNSWQPSTERWFVLVWSVRVWRDSHSSCKSSPALLLKMEQHTILFFLPICLPLSLHPPSLPHPRLSVRTLFCAFTLRPVCQCALLSEPAVSAEAPHSLTDREPVRTTLSHGPGGSHWPCLLHRWGVKWLNELLYTLTHWDLRYFFFFKVLHWSWIVLHHLFVCLPFYLQCILLLFFY